MNIYIINIIYNYKVYALNMLKLFYQSPKIHFCKGFKKGTHKERRQNKKYRKLIKWLNCLKKKFIEDLQYIRDYGSKLYELYKVVKQLLSECDYFFVHYPECVYALNSGYYNLCSKLIKRDIRNKCETSHEAAFTI